MTSVRIAHAITKGDVGGAQTHVVALAVAQHIAGHRVAIVAGSDGPAMRHAREHGVDVVIAPALLTSRHSFRQLGALRELRRVLRSLAPEIVHGHSSHAGLMVRLAARLDGYPSVYTAHGWPFQVGAPLTQRVASLVGEMIGGRVGGAVIVLTEAEAERARRAHIARPDRIWVVENGLDDVEARRVPSAPGSPPALVMVARFAPPKLQREVIGAMAQLTEFSWSLTFVGDGPEFDATKVIGADLLGDRVRFLGHRDDVAEVLARHDVSVLWSRYEGMPISLLEGMRAGLCCIGRDLPGVRVLLGQPPAGLIAAGERELVAAVRSILVDPTLIEHFGTLARARFQVSFTADAMTAATEVVYEAVVRRR
ncbi:MAG: glycosyltransferase [Ilumatobacteraceae bacterium]